MDFTYIIALFIAVIIGFASALAFVAVRGQSYRRLFLSAIAATVAADFALLVDWGRWEEITVSFLVTDAAFFAGYAIVGCVAGALPVLGSRWLYRRLKVKHAT